MAPTNSAENSDITIKVDATIQDAIEAFARLRKSINSQAKGIADDMRGWVKRYDQILAGEFSKGFQGQDMNLFQGIKSRLEKESAELKRLAAPIAKSIAGSRVTSLSENAFSQLGDSIISAQKNQQSYWDSYMSNIQGANRLTTAHGKALKGAMGEWPMWALGVMFFGQSIQRVFTGIAKSGLRVFQDVMHSVEGTITNFDLLKGSLLFLGFAIGAALDPVLSFLIPIVDAIAEFVINNQQLVASFILLGGAIGALFATGGAVVLGIDSLRRMQREAGIAGLKLKGLAGAGAIGISFFMLKDSVEKFKEGEFVQGLLSLGAGISSLVGGARMISGRTGGGAFIALGIVFELLSMDGIFEKIGNFLDVAVGLVVGAFTNMGQSLKEILADAILDPLKRAEQGFRALGRTGTANKLKRITDALESGDSKSERQHVLDFVEQRIFSDIGKNLDIGKEGFFNDVNIALNADKIVQKANLPGDSGLSTPEGRYLTGQPQIVNQIVLDGRVIQEEIAAPIARSIVENS